MPNCFLETDSTPLTKPETEIRLTETPKPKPRVTKPTDGQALLTTTIDEPLTESRQRSPVRDDTLDDDSTMSPSINYSDKKYFWETVSKDRTPEISSKKRFSLFEETPAEKISIAKKRTSIHEMSDTPPVPKPRMVRQGSQSISEEVSKDLSLGIKSETEPLSEYKSAYVHPGQVVQQSEEMKKKKVGFQKGDSSESEESNQSVGCENAGYISDSGDVEQYISDSEIEDRVPQIRERQMSVFHPPAAAGRKSIHERSMSLPTEDMYDLSARNISLRKQYYEEQIRKEMVDDQLMTELEEEPSPEHKSLSSFVSDDEVSAKDSSKDVTSVKDRAKIFGDTVKTMASSTKSSPKEDEYIEQEIEAKRKSVKELAKSFESESGSLIIGQKVITKSKTLPHDKVSDSDAAISVGQIQMDEHAQKAMTEDISKDTLLKHKDIEYSELKMSSKYEHDILDSHKIIDESVDETTTDVTMQDFETSEELGSKEIDEGHPQKLPDTIQSIKETMVSFQEMPCKLKQVSDKSDSIVSHKEETTTKSELIEDLKLDFRDDHSEIEEKSEESKITYASDIEKDEVKSFKQISVETTVPDLPLYKEKLYELKDTTSSVIGQTPAMHEAPNEFLPLTAEGESISTLEMKSDDKQKVKHDEHVKVPESVAEYITEGEHFISPQVTYANQYGELQMQEQKDLILQRDQRDVIETEKLEDKIKLAKIYQSNDQIIMGSKEIFELEIERREALIDKEAYEEKLLTSDEKECSVKPEDSFGEKDADTEKTHKSDYVIKGESLSTTHKPKVTYDSIEKHIYADKSDFEIVDMTERDRFDKMGKDIPHYEEQTGSILSPVETHKEIDAIPRIQKSSTESEHSVFSEHSMESTDLLEDAINNRDDATSKPGDSMEVHVDKSEIEDSEKIADTDQDVTDMETKSLDSLNAIDISPKTSFNVEDMTETTTNLSTTQFLSEQKEILTVKHERPKDVILHYETVQEKTSPIHRPEEHIQDTVWEVSIETQPRLFEENVTDLQLTKEAHAVKDEDLSSSVHDDSDLGSEIHQDHSDSYSSDKLKSSSHDEIEKIILESLHQQKISEGEAKIIANELLADIELEIQKRQHLMTETKILPSEDVPESEVSEYLRHLAESKGLDSREVQLVQSVIARKQRELSKLSRDDTQASSMEITDEDLRYSGAEIDFSPSASRARILEEQTDQLEAEKALERKYSKEFDISFTERIFERKHEEVSGQKDSEYYDGDDMVCSKSDFTVRILDTIKGDKFSGERKRTILKDETIIQEAVEIETQIKEAETQMTMDRIGEMHSDDITSTTKEIAKTDQESLFLIDLQESSVKTQTEYSEKEHREKEISEKDIDETKTEVSSVEEVREVTSKGIFSQKNMRIEESDDKSITELKEHTVDDIETSEGSKSCHKTTSSSSLITDNRRIASKILLNALSEMEDFTSEGSISKGKIVIDEIRDSDKKNIEKVDHEEITRTSSDESKSSQEETKSPEEQFSTCSSGRKGDSDSKTDKSEVIFRKIKTVSSASIIKTDRKSGIDFEAYSSSGESHYQSFELDSAKSRPCSSDVEGLIAAGSSEYESALTSQDISAPSKMTSYHTAASSLSSKESMRSLDSESSGNLGSVEISEASETLVPSEYESGDPGQPLEDSSVYQIKFPKRQSTELSDFEIPIMQDSMDISEDDMKEDVPSKMKRSYEMTFQPEPRVLVPESPQSETIQEVDEKFGTSLDEGSVLSVSLSSTSSATALRTVIELSHESERQDLETPIMASIEQLSPDDVNILTHDNNERFITPSTQTTSEIATSTHTHGQGQNIDIDNVTIITSCIDENGIQSVSTQVTSRKDSTDSGDSFDPKKRGHRRYESTSSFSTTIPKSITIDRKLHYDLAESDKYTSDLSIKEGSNDEKKDIDEAEKEASYETEADQALKKDLLEGRYTFDDEDKTKDTINLTNQGWKSIKELECDVAESELHEANCAEKPNDLVEISTTIEICDENEIKDDTPEFSSEAQASVGELEQEYKSAVARSQEIHISEVKRQILAEIQTEKNVHKDIFDKRDSHGKLSSTSSEKSSFEEAEAEAVFGMVAHISPAHKVKQICPILEDEDAEKHELETRERAQKEFEERRMQVRDQSPGPVPDIKVTQHMAPLVDRGFHYPDLELEEKVDEAEKSPQTPASSKSSESTDQGQEYVLNETSPEEPQSKLRIDSNKDAVMAEITGAMSTEMVTESIEAEKEITPPLSESPNSDSFEMLEKPDLIDDFVVIEEVGKEAHELDTEGKSLRITQRRRAKRHDQEIEDFLKSAPSPSTKLTDVKYYPDGSSGDELGFEFEDSPPQPGDNTTAVPTKSPRDYVYEYDKELEANRKWIEQQFQGSQAAMLAAGYGYEMEFERGPLEDIKEEEAGDFDSSRIGSLSSQKESGGSLGSVKDSYSSTPEYDVLAGRRYFTRSGEHDDVSMSSLQEFENLERAMSLENRRYIASSQDSSSNGSFKNRYNIGKSGQGDDVSVSSLKEFEGLEKACIAVHKIEVKVKEEEEMLTQIDEGQESIASESESCETVSGTDKKLIPDSDEDDYEKRMLEIDEIIRQAQTNVERFIEGADKTESLGRGDSFEEVAKVPDLDLDMPLRRSSTTKIQWTEPDDIMVTSTDSLDLKLDKPSRNDSADSLDQKTGADVMTASTDSIEFQIQQSTNMTSDSIEIRDGERSYMITSDSLELPVSGNMNYTTSDSIDEDGSRIGGFHDQSSSSTGKDLSASVKEDVDDQSTIRQIEERMCEGNESMASTSATTHATYQYETDSVLSGSFTSGGSNTMVSSTETIDPGVCPIKETVDLAMAVKKVWFDDDSEKASKIFTTKYVDESTKPYVTEVIEPCEGDDVYSHTVHRRVELPPEVRKITFKGPDADRQLRQFVENFGEGEDVQESEEIDEDGNVHVTRVVQRRFIVKTDENGREKRMSGPDIENYFQQFEQEPIEFEGKGVLRRTLIDDSGAKTIYTQQFDMQQLQSQKAASNMPSSSMARSVKGL